MASFAAAKKHLTLLLEIGVTAAALFYVFHDADKRAQMAQAFRHADWRWLLAGLLIYGGVELMAVIRWRLLLRIVGIDLAWIKATAILFVGEFFLTFTPGLVGGDAMRIFYLAREQPDKKAVAFTAVLMDRVMGMLTLICLAASILTLRYDWLSRSPAAAKLTHAVFLILGVGAAALLLAGIMAKTGALASLPLPQTLRDMGGAIKHFAQDWRRTVGAFATTLVSHGCYYTSFCCAARALGGDVTGSPPEFWDVFSIMPIENTLTALPVSFAGIGLRESLFQTLLHDLSGIPAGVGALIGTAGFCLKALWALPGAAVFIGYRFLDKAGKAPRMAADDAPSGANPRQRAS